jgi:lactate racemase
MDMQTLKYGLREIGLSLPHGRLISFLGLDIQPSVSPQDIISRSLLDPLASRPLREIAIGKQSAAILIPGKARVAGTREYVPMLLSELNRAGIPDSRIEVFLADGTHEQHLKSDIEHLLGRDIAARIRCVGHDCRQEDQLTEVGTTSFGTPVFINRRVLEAEVKILTGRIVPHYFAGFSGGRKALIPGVAGYRTILANHRLTLAEHRGIHSLVGPCSLDGNPIHLDMLEGSRMVKPEFCLNTLLNADHQIVGAVAGDFEAAHEEGCRLAEQMLCLTVDKPVDVVITSAGGHPYDSNFMQSLKAVFNIRNIVRPGGLILWVAECTSGIHPGFMRWAAIASDEQMEETVRADYDLTGHNSVMLRNLIRKADVSLFSALPREVICTLGLHPVSSLEEGLRWIIERLGREFTYVVVPYANVMCAMTKQTNSDRAE